MFVFETHIDGLVWLQPDVYGDERGYFLESYSRRRLEAFGIDCKFVQDSASFSRRGTLRGLHFQKGKDAQTKLVRCVAGTILDVALDIRSGSPTFGKAFTVTLSGENNQQLFVPTGFAHGFLTLSETAHVAYKTDAYYAPQSEGAIDALDPGLALADAFKEALGCGDPERFLRSAKDLCAPSWQDYCRSPAFVFKKEPPCC